MIRFRNKLTEENIRESHLLVYLEHNRRIFQTIFLSHRTHYLGSKVGPTRGMGRKERVSSN